MQTGANSALGITFIDATTFNLTASAKITIDNYVYEDGGKQQRGDLRRRQGHRRLRRRLGGEDRRHEDHDADRDARHSRHHRPSSKCRKAPPPTIRNNVKIKLYPDADGRVGRIEVNDRAGARLGFLTQGASGFAIRPGAGGARFAAVPMAISPQAVCCATRALCASFTRRRMSAGRSSPSSATSAAPIPASINPQRAAAASRPAAAGQNRPGQPGRTAGVSSSNSPGAANNRPEQPAGPASNRQGHAAAGTAGAVAARGPDHAAGQSRAAGRNAARGPERAACKPGAAGHAAASRPERTAGKPGAARRAAAPRPERTAGKSGAARRVATPRSECAAGKSGAARRCRRAPDRTRRPPHRRSRMFSRVHRRAAAAERSADPAAAGQPQFAPGAPRPGSLNRPARTGRLCRGRRGKVRRRRTRRSNEMRSAPAGSGPIRFPS